MSDYPQQITPTHAETGRNSAEDELDIGRLLAVLYAGKWWIAGCVVIAVLLAIFYLFITPYTYSVDALLQIQSNQSSPLSSFAGGGGGGMRGGGGALALLGGQESPAQSEIPIITSREVLGKTVRGLNLATSTHPEYLPIIGGALSDRSARVIVSRFDVPDDLFNKPFHLVFDSSEHFKLIGPNGQQVTAGNVGKAAKGQIGKGQPVRIFVRRVKASNWPTRFTLSKRAWLSAVTALQNNLTVKEKTPGSGVLTITLEGQDRSQITKIVNSVAQNYVKQNVEARSDQAAQSLKFLKSQLPKLKAKVNAAEARLAQYQEKNQPVDLSAQAQALLNQASSLEDKRSQLKLKIAELSQQYTSQYPGLKAAHDQLAQLRQQSNSLQKNVNKLPKSQKQMLGLQRNVQVNTQLYTSLLNRAQELRVAKAGTVGNVRIVDKAVSPVSPLSPRPPLVIVIFIVLGLMVGFAIVLLRSIFRRGVSDPQQIERQTGVAVYAVVPYSNWLGGATRRATRSGLPAPILVRDKEDAIVAEALRSLRTSLYFAQMEARSNVIIMTGPSPAVGKSFVSVNLGYLWTQVDQRVVVVDADMRRGRLHEYVGSADRAQGLSELLAGQASLDEAVQRVPNTELDVITSGEIPSNPSELLMRSGFKAVLDELRGRYDLVIVDAPPVLAVTDAAVIVAAAESPLTFMILNSGKHPIDEIEQAVESLSRQRGNISGFILNGYRAGKARASEGYSRYQYAYGSKV